MNKSQRKIYAYFTGYKVVVSVIGFGFLLLNIHNINIEMLVIISILATGLLSLVPTSLWLYYDATHTLGWSSKDALMLVLRVAVGKRRANLGAAGAGGGVYYVLRDYLDLRAKHFASLKQNPEPTEI